MSQHKRVLVHTVNLAGGLKCDDISTQLALLEAADWSLIDVNLESSDGLTFYKQLLHVLQRGAETGFQKRDRSYGEWTDVTWRWTELQPKLIAKLLERHLPVREDEPAPAPLSTASELLQHIALEVSGMRSRPIVDFAQELIQQLHQRGFDLNSRDAQGRTLLTSYALGCREESKDIALEVVQQLLQLGASALSTDKDGRSLLFAWAHADRPDLIRAVLDQKGVWSEQPVDVDIWQRDVEGRTLLEVASGRLEDATARLVERWYPLWAVLRALQHHWIQEERLLQRDLLLENTPLIGDVADIALSFVDGLDRRGQPIQSDSDASAKPAAAASAS